jgi:hypothetical protein
MTQRRVRTGQGAFRERIDREEAARIAYAERLRVQRQNQDDEFEGAELEAIGEDDEEE